mgnify:CR=1 FL=1
MAKRPNSRRNLDIAIERVAGRGPAFVQARTLMADAVVAPMLPDGAGKGGRALKVRFGDAGNRFTAVLDTCISLAISPPEIHSPLHLSNACNTQLRTIAPLRPPIPS